MPKLVALNATNQYVEPLQAIIDELQASLDSGRLRDVAVLMAEHDEEGPGWRINYWGERMVASLLAASTHLQFDIHHRAYDED